MNTTANILTSLASLKEPLQQVIREHNHDIIHIQLYGLGVLAGMLACLCMRGERQES